MTVIVRDKFYHIFVWRFWPLLAMFLKINVIIDCPFNAAFCILSQNCQIFGGRKYLQNPE
jgi:hypothetical protein